MTPTQEQGLILVEASSFSPWERQSQTLISTTCQRVSAASSSTTWFFNRKSEFRRVENMNKPYSPQEKFNVADDGQLSLLREFWRNNYAHVILTAEADSLPTDEKGLIDAYGLVGCQSSRSIDLSVHAKIGASGNVRFFYRNHMMTERTLNFWGQVRQKDKKSSHRITWSNDWVAVWPLEVGCISCGRQCHWYYWRYLWAYSKMHQWRHVVVDVSFLCRLYVTKYSRH